MYERMLDKLNTPTFEEMAETCGENRERFIQINEWLAAGCGTAQTICYPYGNHYGWAVAHKKKKKLICNVFAEADSLTVMLRLSNVQFAQIYDQVGQETQACIDKKYPCGDGGWLHYRVTNETQFRDVQKMLELKCAA